jgi:hypothetical protein
LKAKHCQPRVLYPGKCLPEIKIFTDERKLREFVDMDLL